MSEDNERLLNALRQERAARRIAELRASAAEEPLKQLRKFAVNLTTEIDEILENIRSTTQKEEPKS
ncbi:hypothetical protein FB472_1957 [Rhodoglobus vestalii]|uniref:Uncharacterized protein n=1 Tax=Rhodoglobus vestalii TaxID=193384 RepID=A0A8H2KBQ9_9MICO|nr:hypothetical protein [Rhodoglobus vestalii]TQO20326.1 hypothetical protein FB472_1957 [Rhodoglobus vestalii]